MQSIPKLRLTLVEFLALLSINSILVVLLLPAVFLAPSRPPLARRNQPSSVAEPAGLAEGARPERSPAASPLTFVSSPSPGTGAFARGARDLSSGVP